jgi:hypothetical protein
VGSGPHKAGDLRFAILGQLGRDEPQMF